MVRTASHNLIAAPLNSAAGAPALLPTPTDAGVRVSDTFVETDVRQAVQSLASQAETQVIIDDAVRGATTAIIDDRSFDQALRQVLLPLGFVHREVEGVTYVGLADPDSALFNWLADRYRYTALHRSPEELASLLPARHTRFVRTAPNGGWLLVEAPPAVADQILAELEHLDRPVPQVVLEAMICVYSPQASFRFGFDVDAGVRLYDRTTQLAVSGLSLASTVGASNAAGNLNNFQVTSSLLRMLEQKGFVKIRASPRVMALDGEKAQIRIGRETFFSVQPEGNDFIYRQDIQAVDAGIMLEITPAIRSPYVTVKIDRAEVSEDIRSDETQADPSDRFPVINRRSVSTTVKVLDGETIVIGGLTQRQKVDHHNKVPFLGDLPYVGKIFNRIEKLDTKAEVAIFISPRILKEGYDCAPTHEEDGRDRADGVAAVGRL
ncbi:type II secretion system protein GspD [Pseudobythopirellula maris]|nr:protein transporter [Pseudobythopirellula maris]